MYMLYLYRRVIFGTITRDDLRGILDLSPREKLVFAPLLVLVLWMGVYPSSFLTPIRASVDPLVERIAAAQKNVRQAEIAIPAKAGIHAAAIRASDEWVPALAGMVKE